MAPPQRLFVKVKSDCSAYITRSSRKPMMPMVNTATMIRASDCEELLRARDGNRIGDVDRQRRRIDFHHRSGGVERRGSVSGRQRPRRHKGRRGYRLHLMAGPGPVKSNGDTGRVVDDLQRDGMEAFGEIDALLAAALVTGDRQRRGCGALGSERVDARRWCTNEACPPDQSWSL